MCNVAAYEQKSLNGKGNIHVGTSQILWINKFYLEKSIYTGRCLLKLLKLQT